jgi:hypothetical protein
VIYSGYSVLWKGMPHSYVYHITSHVDVCVCYGPWVGWIDYIRRLFLLFVASVVRKCYVLCTL